MGRQCWNLAKAYNSNSYETDLVLKKEKSLFFLVFWSAGCGDSLLKLFFCHIDAMFFLKAKTEILLAPLISELRHL